MQRRRVLGEEHPDTLTSAYAVASTTWHLGQRREGLALMNEVREQRRRILGERHPDTLKSALDLAHAYQSLGQFLPARRFADLAWEGLREQLGAQHPDTQKAAEVRIALAQMMGGKGGGRKKRKP